MFNTNPAIFQLYHGENKLIFNGMMMRSALYWTNTPSWIIMLVSLKHQSVDRDITPLGHIIPSLSQSVFALSPECCVFNGEVTNTNLIGLT